MTAQQAQAIQVRGLEKSYKEPRVPCGVDFTVARGTAFALLGSLGRQRPPRPVHPAAGRR